MAKDETAQLSLLAEDEDYNATLSRPDWAFDVGDWERESHLVPTPAPPVQERSIEQVRADFVKRAKGDMPTVPNQLGTVEQSPTPTVPKYLGTKSDAATPTVPNYLGTTQQSLSPTVPNHLGTIEQSLSPTVPNHLGTTPDAATDRQLKLDRKWIENHEYYYLRPYINGKRESFYLGGQIDRAQLKAVAIGQKIASGKLKPEILADLEREFPKKVKSYSMMVN